MSAPQLAGTPVLILKEGASRSRGRNAQHANIMVAQIVAGGGAPEMELARRLRNYAGSIGEREQLAINAFADALEKNPATLAENVGLEPIDIIVNLRKTMSKADSGVE